MKRATVLLLVMLFGAFAACTGGNNGGKDAGQDGGACPAKDIREVSGLSKCVVAQAGYYYLGMIIPFSGSLTAFGLTLEQGIVLALLEVNAAGGINGKCLGLVKCDSATDPVKAKAAMAELGKVSLVPAVIGPATSGEAMEALPEAVKAQKVMLSPSASSPALTDIDVEGFFFRSVVSDAVQGVIVSAIAKRENFNKVFVINRDDSYGNGLREVFIGSFTKAGGQANYITYNETDVNYGRTVIDAAKAYAPDAVFLISFIGDGAAILKTAVGDNWTAPKWILPDGPKDQELITTVANNAFLEGVLGTSPGAPFGPDFTVFSENHKKTWNIDPAVFGANGYDAAYLLAIAMALSANPDVGTQVKDSLAKTHSGQPIHPGEWTKALQNLSAGQMDFAGASGPMDFDQNGDVLSNIEEWTIQGGQIKAVGCWTPDGKPCP